MLSWGKEAVFYMPTLLYNNNNYALLNLQVQFGWMMWTVGLEMRSWKIAVAALGEIPAVPIVKTLV